VDIVGKGSFGKRKSCVEKVFCEGIVRDPTTCHGDANEINLPESMAVEKNARATSGRLNTVAPHNEAFS
jgi:hypothetical protein